MTGNSQRTTLTNNFNAPQAIVRAVSADTYDRGKSWKSVTELINPPQMVALTSRHRSRISEDVRDLGYRFWGKVAHAIMAETGETPLTLLLDNERLYAERGEQIIGGQPDSVAAVSLADDSLRITDYKFVGARSTSDGLKPEWEQQLNLYAHLLREYEFDVSELKILAIYRDWTQFQAETGRAHETWWQVFDVPVWSGEKCENFLRDRIALHLNAEHVLDDMLQPCSDDERWARADSWALMKEGRKSAVKVEFAWSKTMQWATENGHTLTYKHDTDEEFIELKKSYTIVKRPGVNVRCESFCPVGRDTGICKQWNKLKPAGE